MTKAFVTHDAALDGAPLAQKARQLTGLRPFALSGFFPVFGRQKKKKTILAHQGKFPPVAATGSVTAAPGEISAPCFTLRAYRPKFDRLKSVNHHVRFRA